MAYRTLEVWAMRLMVLCLLTIVQLRDFAQVNQGSLSAVDEARMSPLNVANKNPSKMRIVLFLGLEGVGHHLIGELSQASQAKKNMTKLGIYPVEYKHLQNLLHKETDSSKGLWSATCPSSKKAVPNVTKIEEKLLTLLGRMKEASQDTDMVIPANTLIVHKGDEAIHGMLSYPQFNTRCRALAFPNVDVWYKICQKAEVTCQHVYLYRDPYAILHSTTTKRKFNYHPLHAIHLYTNLLQTLYGQLARNPTETIGCVGLFDEDPSTWQPMLQALLGLSDKQIAHVFKPPSQTEKKETAGATTTKESRKEYQPYMEAFIRMHHDVVDLCQRNLKSL
eukprot:scaffold1170_cov122-Cylindrotheca_fusiformis.AAC.14